MLVLLSLLPVFITISNNNKKESFGSAEKYKTQLMDISSEELEKGIIINKEQRYLTFLDKVLINYKKNIKGENMCNPQISDLLESKIFNQAYAEYNNVQDIHQDKCISISHYLCETIDPSIRIQENTRFPPKWMVKSHKDLPPPTMINLKCFNDNYKCCKKSADNILM